MSVVIVLLGVFALLLLIAWARLNAFLAFIIVSLGVGLAEGMDALAVVEAIKTGIGHTLGFLVLILGLGAMLGKLVADSGAAQRIAQTLVAWFGLRRVQIALMLTGFIVGVPMFYSVGFVILVPLVFTLAAATRLPLLYVGLPMLSALSVTHGYLPPHPAPTAIAHDFGADIGLTMLYGFVVAIPAILVAGPLFSRTLKGYQVDPPAEFFNPKILSEEEMPSIGNSLFSALLPVLLIGASTAVLLFSTGESLLGQSLRFLGDPVIAMLVAVLVAIWTLGLRQGKKMTDIMASMTDGVKSITMILLIIAGAGALKEVLIQSGVSDVIAEWLIGSQANPLFLAWAIASVIRVCVGSATVAGLTTSGIITPFVAETGASPELMVLATGAGSLLFSHVNDTGFWMFKEYFGLSLKQTFASWSIMETIVSVMGLLGVLVLDVWL
ncbi:MAG: TRAP transporter large permease subunit [Bacteroidetes bacterium]|nr:MAG: TRAP transporter large permease subunit [Bacteroidota bacterium]